MASRTSRGQQALPAEMKALFVSVNPALNMFLRFENIRLGQTNRTKHQPIECADGKSLNSARAFRNLGGSPTVILASAGAGGKFLENSLRAESIRVRQVTVPGECRRIFTLLTQKPGEVIATHLIEEGPRLFKRHLDLIVQEISRVCGASMACILAGSLPPGAPHDFYARVIREIRAVSKCVTVLDTSGPALKGALKGKPHIIKINISEFQDWTRLKGPRAKDVKAQMAKMCEAHQIEKLIVTRGSQSAYAYCGSDFFEAFPPRVRVVNPAGAGDSFSAGLIVHLARGFDFAFKMAIAAGAANVTQPIPGAIQPSLVEAISRRVRFN